MSHDDVMLKNLRQGAHTDQFTAGFHLICIGFHQTRNCFLYILELGPTGDIDASPHGECSLP